MRGWLQDELTCIGCKNCVFMAPATFRIEPNDGRSRVFGQWLNSEGELQQAIGKGQLRAYYASVTNWSRTCMQPAAQPRLCEQNGK